MAGKEIGCRIFGIKCLRNCRNHRFPRHTPFYILHFNFYILTFYSSSSCFPHWDTLKFDFKKLKGVTLFLILNQESFHLSFGVGRDKSDLVD